MFDLISIGDCTVDHFFKIHDAHLAFSVDKTKQELCINYGAKLPAENYYQMVAGNAANTAVGAARLGLKTAIYINVGSDAGGKLALDCFKEEGVSTRYAVVNKEMSSNASAVINFRGERTILVYHQPWHYQLPDLDRTKWVYFTSVSHSFTQSYLISQLEGYLERIGAKLAFNPGTFQLEYGVKKFPKLLSLTTLLVVNRDEAGMILGCEAQTEPMELLVKLADLGPQMVVITDGEKGSFGFDGSKFTKLGIFPATVADKTGAGDAFAIGTLAGLFHGEDLPEAMRWGAANSASVVEQIGAQNGLLSFEKIQEKLRKESVVAAKNFSGIHAMIKI